MNVSRQGRLDVLERHIKLYSVHLENKFFITTILLLFTLLYLVGLTLKFKRKKKALNVA